MIMKKKQLNQFWVTNRSNRNVSLADLALNIPAFRTVNLMDTKHYAYTKEQLQKSAQSGSIFKKRDKIIIRTEGPDIACGRYIDHSIISNAITVDMGSCMPSREKSVLEIKEEKYEELQISDEEFVSDSSDVESQETDQT